MASYNAMDTMPKTVQNVLVASGAFAELESAARWTEQDYLEHCLPKNAGPYDHLTEEDWEEYERQQAEDEKNQPWCNYCHPQSGCDGDHGDEMRGGFLLYRGPVVSPLTVPQAQAQPQEQPQEQAQLQPEERPACSPSLQCYWPEFCRCGWQYDPIHQVLEYRDGTAKWDPMTEVWTWISKYGGAYRHYRDHFPLYGQPQAPGQQRQRGQQQQQEQEQQQIQAYIEEVDAWARDVERLIAESKAIREAPLSAFADLAGLEDDDTIPEVDIDAA
jgi:hypothetical protein